MFKVFWFHIMAFVVICFSFISCEDEGCISCEQTQNMKKQKVAVIVSLENTDRWKRTLQWTAANIREAQRDNDLSYDFQFVFFDENASELSLNTFITNVLCDSNYVAMIGPESSAKAENVAFIFDNFKKQYQKNPIPLILPVATSIDLQREYVGSDWLWCLSESNLTQSEALLSVTKSFSSLNTDNVSKLHLICTTDSYGKSFSTWLPFVATERAMNISTTLNISENISEVELKKILQSSLISKAENGEIIIVACSNPTLCATIDSLLSNDESGKIFVQVFSDSALPDRMGYGVIGSYGVAIGADPAYGFRILYETKFNEFPVYGEPQVYDALMLTWLGLCAKHYSTVPMTQIDAMKSIARESTREAKLNYTSSNLKYALDQLKKGEMPSVVGATGPFVFDSKYGSIRENTSFVFWHSKDGVFSSLEDFSTKGVFGTQSSISSWNFQMQNIEDDSDTQGNELPVLHDRWALLVAGSDTWQDYRHQADVLAMYWTLKYCGYDDDHIILVEENNLAYNIQNPVKGNVHNSVGGFNLYNNAYIDYQLSQLKTSDIGDILCGNARESLSKVLHSDGDDDVFVFWCGHGETDVLKFGQRNIYASEVNDWLTRMENDNKYRKLLFVVETCYAGSVAQYCSSHKRTLFITAANSVERSYVDMTNLDENLDLYVSNGFSNTFIQMVGEHPNVSLRDLYYGLVLGTSGSHVSLYGSKSFGNLYDCSMKEFF